MLSRVKDSRNILKTNGNVMNQRIQPVHDDFIKNLIDEKWAANADAKLL